MQTEQQNPTNFTPHINSKSKEIINRKKGGDDMDNTQDNMENPGERLYREGIVITYKLIILYKLIIYNTYIIINQKNKKRDNEGYDYTLDNCTFSPQLYYSSIQPGGNINDFLERQQVYNEIKKERQVIRLD